MILALTLCGCSKGDRGWIAAVTRAALCANPYILWEGKLTASDGYDEDAFGLSVSRSGDGVASGAFWDDDRGSNSGSVYVHTRAGTVWSQRVKFTANDGAAQDMLGVSVSMGYGVVTAGASGDDDRGSGAGAAYVFSRNGAVWGQWIKLTASDGGEDHSFGTAVDHDNHTFMVGAPLGTGKQKKSGVAYAFHWGGLAAGWIQQARLTASDGATTDYFGFAVANQKDTALVGAPWHGTGAGAAYVFVRTGTVWSQQAKLTASDRATGDKFGWSVGLYGDDAIVGASEDDDRGMESGSAYVFVRTGTVWSQQAKLTASDGDINDAFGLAADISASGVLVGAPMDDDRGKDSGSAYSFVRVGTKWISSLKITASNGAKEDGFGGSLSLFWERAAIGATGDDDHGNNSGATHVLWGKCKPNPEAGPPDLARVDQSAPDSDPPDLQEADQAPADAPLSEAAAHADASRADAVASAGINGEEEGCTCTAATGGARHAAWFLALALFLLIRRARRPAPTPAHRAVLSRRRAPRDIHAGP